MTTQKTCHELIAEIKAKLNPDPLEMFDMRFDAKVRPRWSEVLTPFSILLVTVVLAHIACFV